jgi:thiamine pyrophosphate-dependent acetolactate synthase large subunit-like protein
MRAERLTAPVCVGYQHNDAFPGSHPLFAGPLGYNGSKAGMELIGQADVVLCLGTRLNPFSTLPGYGLDYWPKTAKIIQVDLDGAELDLDAAAGVGADELLELGRRQVALHAARQRPQRRAGEPRVEHRPVPGDRREAVAPGCS